MRMAHLRAAFGRGLILAGKAIRCVSRAACGYCKAAPKLLLFTLVGFLPTVFADTSPVKVYVADRDYGDGISACNALNTLSYPSGWGFTVDYVTENSVHTACNCFGRSLRFLAGTPSNWGYVDIRYTCPSGLTLSSDKTACSCPAGQTQDAEGICVACPAHASGTPCVCDAGYEFDATRTSCVSTCPVPDLTPITDPTALLFESGQYNRAPDLADLTPVTNAGLSCIEQQVAALGHGMSAHATSGYRSPAYQTHLREVWDKWQLLKGNDTVECRTVKADVGTEWNKHAMVRQPGVTSNHSTGTAVDIAGVPAANADAIAAQCNMHRPLADDRVHFEPR